MGFEKAVRSFSAVVSGLKEEKEKQRVDFFELKVMNDEVVKRFNGLKIEFAAGVEEKKAEEKESEGLGGEKGRDWEGGRGWGGREGVRRDAGGCGEAAPGGRRRVCEWFGGLRDRGKGHGTAEPGQAGTGAAGLEEISTR